MSFKESVKDAARGRWLELLVELGGIPRELLDGKNHRCPRPGCFDGGGKDRFRLIDEDAGAVLCNQCFSEKNGDGIAAIGWMRGIGFKETLELVAERLGVKRVGRRKRGPDADLELEAEDRLWLASSWLELKGVSSAAVLAAGGKAATWKRAIGVLAVPIRRSPSSVSGWIIWNRHGGTLPRKGGDPRKMLSTYGSKAGWVGDLERALEAPRVWKVEGPTDAMALWDAVSAAGKLDAEGILSNAFGAKEKPSREYLAAFKGKAAVVVPDGDPAGREGGSRWLSELAKVASSVSVANLPEGEDLRSWLASGRSFADLEELLEPMADASGPAGGPPLASSGSPVDPDAADPDWIEEEDDDPWRLGRLFYARQVGRVATHAQVVHFWQGRRWVAISRAAFSAHVGMFVRKEFQRLAFEAKELSDSKEDADVKPQRIGNSLLNSTERAVMALSCINDSLEYGTMINRADGPGPVETGERRNCLAMGNGLLDLDAIVAGREPFLLEHTPEWFSPVAVPYDFDPAAEVGPHWTNFLETNLEGDAETVRCLQQWMGYCLTNSTDYHKFLLLEGEGANGKSVFCAVLEALLGTDNVSHVPLEAFGQRFQLCSTIGKLANVATEVPELDKVSEAQVKQFTDGSVMHLDRKNRDAIEVRPTAKLVVATNVLPRIADKSLGMWRRMILVPFSVQIETGSRVLGMDKPTYWYDAGEMPGILNWALEGLKDLLTVGEFSIPERSTSSVEEYRQDVNPAREFLLDALRASDDSSSSVQTAAIYDKYKKFCEDNSYHPLGARSFGKEVKRVFPKSERSRKGPRGKRFWCYSGIEEIVEY